MNQRVPSIAALLLTAWAAAAPQSLAQSLAQPPTAPYASAAGSAAPAKAWGQPALAVAPATPFAPPEHDFAASVPTIATAPTLFADPAVRLAQAPALGEIDPFAGPPSSTPKLLWPPPGGRDTSFQRATIEGSFLPAFENDGLGITGVRANAVFGLPAPTRASPLLITPGFETLLLDGPGFTDVPPRLHAATLELSHFTLLSDRWLLNTAATVGVYADDHSFDDADALRVTGRVLGVYQWTHRWKAILGLVYLNRGDFSVIPAAGLQYEDPCKKIDLIFPRPRIAWRLDGCGPPGPGAEQHWLFLGGEFGGNEWAVQRAAGPDTLDYTDLRVQVGYEVKRFGGLSTKYELGYVFARELEFGSEGVESELDDTLFFRVGWTY